MRLHKRLLIGTAIFMACVSVFAVLSHEAVREKDDHFDAVVFNLIAPYSSPPVIRLMRIFSFFGSHMFLLPAYVTIAIVLVCKKQWRDALFVSFIAISSFVLMLLLKNYFRRDRPTLSLAEVVNSFSFPSGHTLSSFVLAVTLIYLVRKTHWNNTQKVLVSVLLVLFSLLIGLSRIFLKVHYATDVIAGLCVGGAWMILIFWIKGSLGTNATI